MSDDDGRSSASEPSAADDGPPFSPTDGTEEAGAAPSTHDGTAGTDPPDSSPGSPLRRLLDADRGPLMVLRETLVSIAIVALVGLLLFTLSGVWPPMVAVESGSMEPHMHRGDLVFVSEPGRYVPDSGSDGRGVVTRAEGKRIDYRTFGGYGSVIVYDSPSRGGPPVIHRAHFWVAEGENWFAEADPSYHHADSCRDLPNCPAPHAGFVTKGDANGQYDQVNGISGPVRPAWIAGIAHVRVPYLGYVRLWFASGAGPPIVVDPGGSAATSSPA
ncbi:MAG: S26 family signal peptidase [Haloferacaceae archaeon]